MPDTSPWVVEITGPATADTTLLCLPFAGGGIASLHRFTSELPAHLRCMGVRYPGRESRIRETPIASAHKLADQLLVASQWQTLKVNGRIIAFTGRVVAI